jgi:hypothetical protein
MKKVFCLAFVLFSTAWCWADEVAIGKERIEPLKYPKFSLTYEYDFFRKMRTLGDDASTSDLRNQQGIALSFEASLYKYLNAGAAFTVNIPSILKDPVHLRLALFAKPFIPLGERFDLFARLGFGLGGMLAGLAAGAAVHSAGSVGIEYFPWSRLGLALEYGLRAELIRLTAITDKENSNAKWLAIYETPVAMTLHLIL